MRVLVVGNGGREHALCWKLRQSPACDELFCAPGSDGIAAVADCVPIAVDEVQRLADFVEEMKIDLTVVGPELPLTLGLVDELESRGRLVFGPRRRSAELEGSKVFAKQFMERHDIPTAPFQVVHDAKEAKKAAKKFGFPVVLKADGLAGGKGVLIIQDKAELEEALETLFEQRRFGAAGDRVIVEAFLAGEEVSFIAICDGDRMVPLATSKDYKRIGEKDTGPNTGGMGAHSPSLVLSQEQAREVVEQVLRPTVEGMAAEGSPFKGFLYAGLMVSEAGIQVLEFNVRLGDPEAQALLLRLDEDLLDVLAQAAAGELHAGRLAFKKEASACIVLASRGYPGKPAQGDLIKGLERVSGPAFEGIEVFHAGTVLDDDGFHATGGRVLNVCATGIDLVEALRRAYAAVELIRWPARVLRRDIGRRVLV